MPRYLRLWMLAALLWLPQVQAAGGTQGIPVIAVAELPAEARDVLQAIKRGGPFAYERDGAEFGNYERILPRQPRNYYREYTVKTPGARNRGARRVVCGPLPEGNSEKGRERNEAQGARSGATETYHDGRGESEHRATQRFVRAATFAEFPECYYTENHYQTFKRIRE